MLPHAPYVFTESGAKYDGPKVGGGTTVDLADMLDIEVPWPMDGSSAPGRDPRYVDPGCEDVRRYMRFDISSVGGEPGDADLFEFCANDVVPHGLEPILGELRPDDEWETAPLARLTPFGQLLGTPWSELEAEPSETAVTLERSTATFEGSSPPIDVIRGTVEQSIDVIVPSDLLSENGYDVRAASLEVVDGELVASELSVDR